MHLSILNIVFVMLISLHFFIYLLLLFTVAMLRTVVLKQGASLNFKRDTGNKTNLIKMPKKKKSKCKLIIYM